MSEMTLEQVRDWHRSIAESNKLLRAIADPHEAAANAIDAEIKRQASAQSAETEWHPMATAPRDGSVILLRWGQDHISPGWWSAPVSPVQNDEGTWPTMDGYPWSFVDMIDGHAFVNRAADNRYGPTHWALYTAPPAAAAQGEAVAWIRKDGFRFNADIEPQDDSEIPLYAASPAAVVPDGWKLVPIEPTREMLVSAAKSFEISSDRLDDTFRPEWKAMLAAAPKPETEG